MTVAVFVLAAGAAAQTQQTTTKLAAGQQLFADKGCAHCHGDQAQGTDRGPNLQGVRKRLSKREIKKQIVDGGQGMPAFGDSLDSAEVKQLIKFLRSLKPVKAPPQAPAQR